jgi:uncharacterized membrane protein
MTKEVMKGAMVAAAVGSLLASGGAMGKDKPAKAKSDAVKCAGINECKGHGSCASANNACKGQNGCKGQGVVDAASADECTAKGGTVMAGQ